jgi:hypothetical protein
LRRPTSRSYAADGTEEPEREPSRRAAEVHTFIDESCVASFAGLDLLCGAKEVTPSLTRREVCVDTTLIMRFDQQLVATDGNGFGLISPISRPRDLPPFATGCNRGAP